MFLKRKREERGVIRGANHSLHFHIRGKESALIGKERSHCGRETEDVLPSDGERG